MIVPSNVINSGLYTSGNEYRYKSDNTFYVGYYYGYNGSFFVGKEFSSKAPELIHDSKSNTLLNSGNFVYSIISGTTSQDLEQPYIPTIQFTNSNDPGFLGVRYFYRKVLIQPIIIKEISKESYNSIKNNSLYQTTFVGNGQTLDQADMQLPGLKIYLGG